MSVIVSARHLQLMTTMTNTRKRGAVLQAAQSKAKRDGKYMRASLDVLFNDALPPDERGRAVDYWSHLTRRRLYLGDAPNAEIVPADKGGGVVVTTRGAHHGIDRMRFPKAAAWADLAINEGWPACKAAEEVMNRRRPQRPYSAMGARKAIQKELLAAGCSGLWEAAKKRPGKQL